MFSIIERCSLSSLLSLSLQLFIDRGNVPCSNSCDKNCSGSDDENLSCDDGVSACIILFNF